VYKIHQVQSRKAKGQRDFEGKLGGFWFVFVKIATDFAVFFHRIK